MQKFKIANSVKKADKDRIDNGEDDWETDPDFERDMSEIDQRWGSKRTVGSINMSQLIKDVHEDHQLLNDKYGHESQKDYSTGFGGKFGIQKDRQDSSALNFDHIEKLSKHTSQQINKFESSYSTGVISASDQSCDKNCSDSIKDDRVETSKETLHSAPCISPKPTIEPKSSQAIKERIKAMSSRCDDKVIHDNISANIPSSVRQEKRLDDSNKIVSESIKSMSKRFENMCQNNQDNFRKLTDERRKEFFNEIRSQVKETRKGYDGFDTPEECPENSSKNISSPANDECHSFTRKEIIKTNISREDDKIVHKSLERQVESSTSPGSFSKINDDEIITSKNLLSQSINTDLKAIALYDYIATDDDEISFQANDIIMGIEKVDSGWYKGKVTQNGKISTGLFPANHARILDDITTGDQ